MMPTKPLRQLVAERIDASGLELPVYGEAAMALLRLATRDDVSVQEIEGVISRDPAMSAEVMRASSSSFFAGLGDLRSLRHAIMRLGVQRTASLALAAAQRSLSRSRNALVDAHMQRAWRASHATALGARWIAERAGLAGDADSAFLAGLLHDIGRLLVLKVIEDIAETHPRLALTESFVREILDALHAEQGAALLKHWNVPEVYCTIARDHHLDSPDAGALMTVVRLADQACRRLGANGAPDNETLLFATPEAQAMGLGEIQLAELEILIEDALGIAPA